MAVPADSVTDQATSATLNTAPVNIPGMDVAAQPTTIRYAVPALPKDDSLGDLARGLGSVSSSMTQFLDKRQQQQDELDKAKAQADFQTSHATSYADAVQSGAIPASASPAYIASYKEAQGTLAGQMMEQKFQAAYDAWDGKGNVDDPTAYSKFTQDFLAKNIGTTDPAVLRGLLPVVHQFTDQGMREHIQDLHNTVVQGYQDTQSAVVNNGIAAATAYANSSGNPVDPSYIAGVVGHAYTTSRSLGVTDDQAQKNAIVQITTAALLNKAHHGDEILSALDVPLPGTNLTLSQTTYGAEEKARVTNQLDAYQREQVTVQSRQQVLQNKQALGVVESRVLENMSKDPTAMVPEADLKEGAKYDPTFRSKVVGWQKGMTEATGQDDPQAIVNLQRDIMSGAGPDAVTHAMDTGQLKNPRTVKEMLDLVKEHATADPVMQGLTNSEPYKSVVSTIKQQTSATGLTDPFGSAGMSAAGLGLQYELNRQMQEWAAANPGATNAQTQAQFGTVSAGILKLITQPATKDTPMQGTVQLPAGNPYAGPAQPTAPGAPQPSPTTAPAPPATPAAQPPAAPGAVSPASATSPQPQPAPDPNAVKTWVASLSPAQQENMARASLRTGLPPDQVAAQAYQHAIAKGLVTSVRPPPAGSNTQPGAAPGSSSGVSPPASSSSAFGTLDASAAQPQYAPGAAEQFGDAVAKWRASDPNAEATIHQLTGVLQGMHSALPYQGSTTLAAIKDNPQAAHILDFVSGPESGGNYNAYYGHANSTKDLSGMTLNQVLTFQHNLVHVDGLASSATGRYQFMPATLTNLMKQMDLTGNERFTPEMQDNLALQLLKNRGLEQWQQGKLSDATFMNNLAFEWASLPNPHTGRSQYAGDGLNKSLVTPAQVSTMLGGAKSLMEGTSTPAPAPSLGVPTPPPQAAQANSATDSYVAGDSLGDGVRAAMKAPGLTTVGRQPADVLRDIESSRTPSLADKASVVLSSGMSNNSSADISVVGKQIDALIKKGATPGSIKLLGVGDRADYVGHKLNEQLQAVAAQKGVTFIPVADKLPKGEHVHPDTAGYAKIGQLASAKKFVSAEDDTSDTNED